MLRLMEHCMKIREFKLYAVSIKQIMINVRNKNIVATLGFGDFYEEVLPYGRCVKNEAILLP